LVELVYQRGAFVSSDTASVVFLTRILVPGFVAEGLWLVLAQGMLATGRNDLVLRVWFLRFAAQLVLTIALGLPWGAAGVAAAYSLSMLIATALAAAYSAGLRTFESGSSLLVRSVQAGLVTAGVAVALMLASSWIPAWLAAIAVVLVAVTSAYLWRLSETVIGTLSGRSNSEQGSGI
jgi:peptidoglycan biosynthesis protein MviN/MurJ (putative lipid II flippase)